MALDDDVIILGGQRHGKRYSINPMSHTFNMMRPVGITGAYWPLSDSPTAALTPEIDAYNLIDIPLPGGQSIRGAVHPHLSRETGIRMLTDLVLRAWREYDHA